MTTNGDIGAATQDRFRFQHHCVARHLLLAIIGGRSITIVCEHLEDFIVLDGTRDEAVSVKHRELARGPFTAATLMSDGGLIHLFETWRDCNETPRCRLMTNAGLTTGKTGAAAVATFSEETNAFRDDVLADLCARLDAPADVVARFLSDALRIDAELPHRHLIGTQQRIDLLGPAFARLGRAADASPSAYAALLSLIAERSAETAPIAQDVRLALVTRGPEQQQRLQDAEIAGRKITSDEAAACIRDARQAPYMELPAPSTEAPVATKLTRKLRAGGLSPTGRSLAVRLRNVWYAAEAQERDTPGIDRELSALEASVQAEAAAAQRNAAAAETRPYGDAMLDDLRGRLSAGSTAWAARPEFVDPKVLEGLAYELTDRCEVWWSPEEDVVDDA